MASFHPTTIATAALLASLLQTTVADAADVAARVIRVDGHAEVTATPDVAAVVVTVATRDASAAAAVKANATISEKVTGRLRRLVDSADDVQSAGYTLTPEYEYDRSGDAGRPVLVGYVASNRVRVVLDDIGSVGSAIDAAVGSGATGIDSIEFSLRDTQLARRQALLEAGRRARGEAEAIAESLGVSIGEVLDASSSSQSAPGPVFARYDLAEAKASYSAPTEIAPGGVDVSATVTVTFAIR